ncbi:MAG TPA: type II toxin-antitoxin system HipA family toxin [Tepidisphaeraceae bacterium]|nr:type II toxin-antitoxin system HipA family toxin [Tepidisphaeraceae bacterium]
MKKLTVKLRWSPTEILTVGQLADVDHRVYFEYDADFLQRNLQISPFKWPLRPGLIEHIDRSFGPLPGVIDDSLPDGWGLLLMDQLFRKQHLDPVTISPLDRLSYLAERPMGALVYLPAAETERDEELLNLHKIGKNAQEIYGGEAVEILPQLIRAGGSPGGARPKVLVGVKSDTIISGEDDLPGGFEHWIVKFCAKVDRADAGPMEFAYAKMAEAAGIEMPATRLFKVAKGTSYFGVRRFDRAPGNARVHVHTFGNLIHANFRIPSTDYADLMKVTHLLTRNYQDLLRVVRRMAFNIAAHNRDDHAKNFAFTMNPAGEWSLSPAYDLGYAPGPGGEHTMTILGEGREPKREHILQLAKQFDIHSRDVSSILDEVNATIAKWPQFADQAGCSKKTIRAIQSALRVL